MGVYCANHLERENQIFTFMSVQMESKHKHGCDDTPARIRLRASAAAEVFAQFGF